MIISTEAQLDEVLSRPREADKAFMAQLSALAIPKAAKNKEDAWKFIEVAARHELQVKVLELTLQSPGETQHRTCPACAAPHR